MDRKRNKDTREPGALLCFGIPDSRIRPLVLFKTVPSSESRLPGSFTVMRPATVDLPLKLSAVIGPDRLLFQESLI